MIRKKLLVAAGASLSLFMSVAFADRSAGENIDDTALVTSVKMSLIGDSDVHANRLNVEVYKGDVQLIGYARSKAEKDAAIAHTKGVEGVERVHDAILIDGERRSFGRTLDDKTTQAAVKAALADLGTDRLLKVVTDVHRGEALVGGFVRSKADADEVIAKVKGVKGVTRVHNRLVVKT